MRWDYAKQETGKQFTEETRDLIEIEKNKLTDGKVHVIFRLYDEIEDFQIDNTKIKAHQKPFVRSEDESELAFAWMYSEIDVSELLKDSDP